MLEYRPAALICLALTVGIAAGLFLNFWITAFALSIMWGLIMLKRPNRRRRFVAVTAVVFVGFGYVYGAIYNFFAEPPMPDNSTSYSLHGVVTDTSLTNSGYRYTVELLDGSDIYEGYTAYYYDNAEYKNGDVVDMIGTLSPAAASSRGNGINYNLYATGTLCENEKVEGFKYELLYLRNKISKLILNTIDGEAGDFYNAVLTGDRSGINSQLNGSFSRSGLSHIIAISGQHFTILVFSIYTMLMLCFGKKKLSSFLCILLAVFYTLLVGASPSVVRACIMCCAIFAANMFNRSYDACTALCLAVMLITLFSPFATASVSFQLSFLSTLGILMLTEIEYMPFHNGGFLKRVVSFIITPIKVSLAATIFCLPVLVTVFDYVSVVSPFSNLAVNVLIGPSMAFSLISLPIVKLVPGAEWFAAVPELLFTWIKAISDYMSRLSFAAISSHIPSIKLIFVPIAVIIVSGLLMRSSKAIKTAIASLATAVIIVVVCIFAHKSDLKDNSYLHISDSETDSFVFYANGEDSTVFSARGMRDCSDYILKRGHTHVDRYIMLQCGEEAVIKLERLLCYVSVGEVYIPKAYYGRSVYRSLCDMGCKVKCYDTSVEFSGFCLKSDGEDYSIEVENNGVSAIFLSGHKGTDATEADALIVTEATVENELHHRLLPEELDTLYIKNVKDTYFTQHLKSKADSVVNYNTTVRLRLGTDGIREIEE